MPARHRASTILGLTAASSLALAGCASGTGPASGDAADGAIAVVASTNVYGQLAEAVGGDLVEVTSIVDSASQDPHSFEPSARDQLTVADAQLVIENGGGYDAFIDALLESSGSEAHVITAVEFSHSWPENAGHEDEHAEEEHAEEEHAEEEHADHGHVEGFNEHVWYDPHTMGYVVEEIAAELAELSPDDAETFSANADALLAEIEGLESELAQLESSFGGAQVFVTEPVSVDLAAAAGLDIVTPDAFSEAVEEGQDVPPATLLEALTLLRDGEVDVVIANAQTGGAETTQVLDEAETASIPVVEFTETLPEGQTYISWMQENIAALGEALEA